MFEPKNAGAKTQGELLEEFNSLIEELKRLDQEIKRNQDLEQLLRMVIDAKNSGASGFYIPPDFAYLKDELQEIVELGAKAIPYADNVQGLVS